jgi:small conductance mechanosensitive channel
MEINTQEAVKVTLAFAKELGLALFILYISYISARLLRGVVNRIAKRRNLPIDITRLLVQISEIGILLFGSVSALGTLGIDVGALIAGLGLIGFALGFALKDLLSNFLAGLLILLYNPFVRGDHITVSGSQGTVVEVNLRYTVLQYEDKKVLIPNSSLFTNVVTVEKNPPLK